MIDFDPVSSEEENEVKSEWRKRINLILNKVSIEIDEESLLEFERNFYPDLRSSLNKIQTWMLEGTNKVDLAKVREIGWSYESLYNLLFSPPDPIGNYQNLVGEYNGKTDDIMSALGDEFVQWVIKNKKSHSKIIPGVIVLVAEHQAQRLQVIDPMVSLLSLFFQIQKLIQP